MAAIRSLSRTNTLDPVASTDAANLGTVSSLLPYMNMAGGLNDYYLYGDLYSTAPRSTVQGTQALSAGRQHFLLLANATAGIYLRGCYFLVTASSGSVTTRAYVYQGVSLSSLSLVATTDATVVTAPGLAMLSIPATYTTTDGWLGVVLNANLTTLTLGSTNMQGGGNFTYSSGYTTGRRDVSSAPPSTLDSTGGLFSAVSNRPWLAFY